MEYIDYFVIAVVLLIAGLSLLFILRQKKKGVKCIGCPDSKTCSGNCSSCSCKCNQSQ